MKQNIATGDESVGGWGVSLEKEFNMRKVAGRETGWYLLQFIYERMRLERMKEICRWY